VTDNKKQAIPPGEWVVAAVGLVLTVALLAFLIRSALNGPRQPPNITVAVDSVVHLDAGWLAFVTASNAGDETAADVTLEGVIGGGEQRSTALLDYLPPRSSRTAVLMFSSDPGSRLAVRASGFR
jgi:uncharacterized protein (TIGR02588 family)